MNLTETVLEIDNKSLSNRPDLWGHYGLAREVGALYGKKLKPYETKEIEKGKEMKIKVEVADKKLCPRYMAVAMSGIKIAPSPEWLQKRLVSIGFHPINNIVDITNYILAELGQPMHAFDAANLSAKAKNKHKKNIFVRPAKLGEEFVTLDDVKLKLNETDLVIADENGPLALAGVMGGAGSGISDSTDTIIFEAANFEASQIRKTSTRYGLRTESSMRFEKSLDPFQTLVALQKAVELTKQVCPSAQVASAVADKALFSHMHKVLDVSNDFFSKIIGADIPVKDAVVILQALGFEIKEKKKNLLVKIPSWRATKDISLPEDIAEEVLRIWGYEKVKAELPKFAINAPEQNKLRRLEHLVRQILSERLSYDEVYNYSFISEQQIALLGEKTGKYLELDNPVSKARPYLRRELVSNLLENIEVNIENYPDLKIFETGRVFWPEIPGPRAKGNGDALLPHQDLHLCAVIAAKKNNQPFNEARRAVEEIMSAVNLPFEISPAKHPRAWQHPARSGLIMAGDQEVGEIFELHPATAEQAGLKVRVAGADLNLEKLLPLIREKTFYQPLPQYPESVRDLSVVVKKEISNADLLKAMAGNQPLLKSVELFDVYEGQNIGAGYKSLAYRLVYGHAERTLTTEEVDAAQAAIIADLSKKFGATVRS